ncbi:MAG: ribosome recycling factor [Candidatus Coatesbacteria bacterium RBG_13_66_14]|uniref:Ribosome-recycling factor n=1 Tax=Candidatus Coatesbacteria bacterium RBG_13_66_14 TaxID=1817816 RepID=A0A1F5FG78_9BACT|nr:MAG: ribosome recycling factor [Candidatus Coatesbacteria bacterium RBG_13_66_14]
MVEPRLKETQENMVKAVEATRRDLRAIRTGRANPAILDSIRVDYYGSQTPLNQMATIGVPEPRMVVIQPWDRTAVEAIVKAIQSSDLGITPSSDGVVIRLPFPPLTEDRRKELVKVAHRLAEEGKVSIRNVRRDANEALKSAAKKSDISEDERDRLEDVVQKMTDEQSAKIDTLLAEKIADISEV